jgi:hypothetical protein
MSCHGNVPSIESYLSNRDTKLKERRVCRPDDILKNVSRRPPACIMGQNVNKQDRLEQLQKVVKMLQLESFINFI